MNAYNSFKGESKNENPIIEREDPTSIPVTPSIATLLTQNLVTTTRELPLPRRKQPVPQL